MFGNINVNKSTKQRMIFNPISRTIKDADNIERTVRAKNAGVEFFKVVSYFNELLFSSDRDALVPEEYRNAHLHAPLVLEQDSQIGALEI
jgi:hypothetical protein